jgi:ribosome biogenesis GTPase
MTDGIIIKGISGFYYVEIENKRIIECKARGRFRKSNLSPVVGDRVKINLIDDSHGYIDEIYERKSLLIRPQVANIDQAIVVFALKKPEINFTLLNKLLAIIEYNKIDVVLCMSKSDLDDEDIYEKILQVYGKVYKIIKISGNTSEGIDLIKLALRNRVSVFTGPSGVGKSTIINKIQDKIIMQTGEVSEKLQRGKHTTRHAELIEVDNNTFIVDTPGFSSIDTDFMEPEELQYYFREFNEVEEGCSFSSCLHYKEKSCGIKNAVDKGIIARERYDAYINILIELMKIRRVKR